MQKIEIRPIERKRWHGKKGKEDFARPIKIQPLVDSYTRTYATGLTKEEIAEYSEYFKEDLNPIYKEGTPHPFWDSPMVTVKLENSTMFLDVESPIGKIQHKIIKASPFVANSLREYNAGLFPKATHVIFDEGEEIEVRAKKVEQKKKAYALASDLSKSQKISIILILTDKLLKGKSDDFIEVELDNIIENKAGEFIRQVGMSREETETQALVLEAIQKGVLIKDKLKIKYHEHVLGSDVYDVVQYLSNDENQDFKIKLLAAIN